MREPHGGFPKTHRADKPFKNECKFPAGYITTIIGRATCIKYPCYVDNVMVSSLVSARGDTPKWTT